MKKKNLIITLVIILVVVGGIFLFRLTGKSIDNPSCIKGYTNEYDCEGNWTLKKYQKEGCSYEWVKWDNCDFGCESGFCKEGTLKTFLFHRAEVELYENEGWKTNKIFTHDSSEIISSRAKAEENLLIMGRVEVNLQKDIDWSGIIREEQVNIYIYKNNQEIYFENVFTDNNGKFRTEKFIPKEIGYYKVIFKIIAGTNQIPLTEDGTWIQYETNFYVSGE